MNRLLKTYLTSTRAFRNAWGRLWLRNRSLSVISNDCWGGNMLKYHHLPFNTPFVGLLIMGPDYIRLLEDIALLEQPLRFIPQEKSRYQDQLRKEHRYGHPIALLGDSDIEIHFLHYPDEATARAKWERRVGRINWDNAIVKFSDRDICDEDLIRRFEALPYRLKVCFNPRPMPQYPSVCYLPEFRRDDHVAICWNVSNRHWSFVNHANSLLPPKKSKEG